MASRPQGVQAVCITGTGILDQNLKTAGGVAVPGILYSFSISWTGATADDLIHIHDTATADATAQKLFTFRVPAAVGSFTASLPAVGIQAVKGLWLNVQAAGAKFSIAVGFD